MKVNTKLMSVVAVAALGGLYGCDGSDGQSAYQIAVANGFTGSEADWIASLDPNSPQNQAASVGAERLWTWPGVSSRGRSSKWTWRARSWYSVSAGRRRARPEIF